MPLTTQDHTSFRLTINLFPSCEIYLSFKIKVDRRNALTSGLCVKCPSDTWREAGRGKAGGVPRVVHVKPQPHQGRSRPCPEPRATNQFRGSSESGSLGNLGSLAPEADSTEKQVASVARLLQPGFGVERLCLSLPESSGTTRNITGSARAFRFAPVELGHRLLGRQPSQQPLLSQQDPPALRGAELAFFSLESRLASSGFPVLIFDGPGNSV